MRNLPQALVPDLPPYVDVNSLSALELRSAMVRSYRNFFVLKRNYGTRFIGSRMLDFDMSAFSLRGKGYGRVTALKLEPGGQHLHVLRLGSEISYVWDLELWDVAQLESPRRAWSYHLQFGAKEIWDYACFLLSPTSRRIAVILQQVGSEHA